MSHMYENAVMKPRTLFAKEKNRRAGDTLLASLGRFQRCLGIPYHFRETAAISKSKESGRPEFKGHSGNKMDFCSFLVTCDLGAQNLSLHLSWHQTLSQFTHGGIAVDLTGLVHGTRGVLQNLPRLSAIPVTARKPCHQKSWETV